MAEGDGLTKVVKKLPKNSHIPTKNLFFVAGTVPFLNRFAFRAVQTLII